MAAGIIAGAGGDAGKVLMTFHPQPKKGGGSSTWFHQDDWLDFNMFQTGHCRHVAVYDHITHDYQLPLTKPTMDGEPIYEDHPVCFNAKENGYSAASDVRRAAYLALFAGAHGHTYGAHAIWQMNKVTGKNINGPLGPWHQAQHFGPLSGGVDYFTHQDSFGTHDLFEDGSEVHRDGYLTDLLSERAVDFVSRAARAALPAQPALHRAALAVGDPRRRRAGEVVRQGPPIYHLDGGNIHAYRRMIHHMDEGIGRVARRARRRAASRATPSSSSPATTAASASRTTGRSSAARWT